MTKSQGRDMRGHQRGMGCVPFLPWNCWACGLWSLTPDKMIKDKSQQWPRWPFQQQQRARLPPNTPFTFPVLLQNGSFTIMRTWPWFCFHISAHAISFSKKLTSPSLPVKTLFISQSNINVSSFKIASLVSLSNSLPDIFKLLLSFIHSKNIFRYVL